MRVVTCSLMVVALFGCGADEQPSQGSLPSELAVFATYLSESSLLLDELPADRDVESLQPLFTDSRWEGVRTYFERDAADFRDLDQRVGRITKFRVDFEDSDHFRATVCTEDFFELVVVSTGEHSIKGELIGTTEVVLIRTDAGWLIESFTTVSSECLI